MTFRLYNTSEAAEILGLGEHVVSQERKSGRLPHRKVGRFIKFADADFEAYLETIAALASVGGMRRSDAARARRSKTA